MLNLIPAAIDRSTCLGKRNYAMVLLAIRTGLRTVDIINLKLIDIDWRSNTINIIQQKNRRPLSLPLLPDVGNALVDYILHARLESANPHIFLFLLFGCSPAHGRDRITQYQFFLSK